MPGTDKVELILIATLLYFEQASILSSISAIKSIDSIDEKTFIVYSEPHLDLAELLFKFAVTSDTIIVEQREQEKSLESIFQKLTDYD